MELEDELILVKTRESAKVGIRETDRLSMREVSFTGKSDFSIRNDMSDHNKIG